MFGQSFPADRLVATFSRSLELRYLYGVGGLNTIEEVAMDEGEELTTAGLVVAFASVLLVASHFFIEAQSAKQLGKAAVVLKIPTNVIASRL